MTIYVVTSGEYSDYGIEAVFTKPELANAYANLDSTRQVEVYEADSRGARLSVFYVCYDFIENKIHSMYETLEKYVGDNYLDEFSMKEFRFYVRPSKRLYKDMTEHSTQSKILLKTAQDRFAKYCAEHETSREELIRAKNKREAELSRMYPMYSTSLDTGRWTHTMIWSPGPEASERVSEILKQKINNGEQLPNAEELEELLHKTLEEVRKEHEEC